MMPDYLTNYRLLLESYEAILSRDLPALMDFVNAVSIDWESTRTKKALTRLDEIRIEVDKYLKKLDQSTSLSESIRAFPSELQRLSYIEWESLADPTNDSIPQPTTRDKAITSSFFQQPEVASILARTFEKVRIQIQTTKIPAERKATEYVDQILERELREAFRSAFSPPNKSTGSGT